MAGIEDFTPEQWQALGAYLGSITPIDQYIRQSYPQMAWALNNPELGPILRQAATEKWDPAKLQGALLNTNWWKSTTEAQRTWQRLVAEDPATANKQLSTAQTSLTTTAQRLGVTIPASAMGTLSQGLVTEGWDAQRITQEIMRYATGLSANGSGDINALVDQVQARSASFLMPMTSQTAFTWAKNILNGTASQEGLDSYLRQQTINRFSGDKTIVDALNNGATAKDIFEPYVQQTAQLLEVSPEQVNLMDTKWMSMIDGNRDDGTRRPMSLSEAAQYVRGLDEWRATKQAGQEAAGIGEQLLKTFGQVA